VLIGGYNLAFQFSPLAGVVMLLLLAAVMPFLVWNSLKFRLFYTSYRGIRFGFGGTLAAYFHFLLLPILYALSLTLALPFVHQRISASSTPRAVTVPSTSALTPASARSTSAISSCWD
jgi:uncharacterized membrane protein YjgN (DUF898 family)